MLRFAFRYMFTTVFVMLMALGRPAPAQDREKPLRERLIDRGAVVTETTVADGSQLFFGRKAASATMLTEVEFRVLPNPLEYIEKLDLILASGPPLRNRSRDQLVAYPFNDDDLIACGKLDSIRVLKIPMTQITDRGLKEYASFAKLEKLDLSHARTTDEGLKALRAAETLKELQIDMTEATDAIAETIAKLKNLEQLDISGSKISEKIVPLLLEMPNLRKVTIHHGQFSETVVEKLRAANKAVEID